MSEGAVRAVVDADIDVSGARMGKIGDTLKQAATQFKAGAIDQDAYHAAVRDWRDNMAAQVKGAHVGQAAAAVGGVDNMTQRDHGRVGGLLRVQYGYLENAAIEFADDPDLVLGNVAGRQGIEQRGPLYAQASRATYERVKDIADGEDGLNIVINILEATAHHCTTKKGQPEYMSCPGQSALGPVRYDDVRRRVPGQRLCQGLCRCGSQRFRTFEAARAAMGAL